MEHSGCVGGGGPHRPWLGVRVQCPGQEMDTCGPGGQGQEGKKEGRPRAGPGHGEHGGARRCVVAVSGRQAARGVLGRAFRGGGAPAGGEGRREDLSAGAPWRAPWGGGSPGPPGEGRRAVPLASSAPCSASRARVEARPQEGAFWAPDLRTGCVACGVAASSSATKACSRLRGFIFRHLCPNFPGP